MIYKLTFGKYKDYEITEVPNTYLEWCVDNLHDGKVRCACKAELADRKFHGEYVSSEFEIDYEELDMWDFDLLNGG